MSEQYPAGWHSDPFGRYERRYWDGVQWTHHVSTRGSQEIDLPGDRRPATPSNQTDQTHGGWHPDPFGRFERRYWDGVQWTHHVSTRGSQETDPPDPKSPQVSRVPPTQVAKVNKQVQRQLQRSGVPLAGRLDDEPLFTESVLVINQKAKLLGSTVEYAIYDQQGQKIAAVREIGRGLLRSAIDVRSDAQRRYKLEVVGQNGQVLIALTRPANLLKSKMIVTSANGTRGEIVQKTLGLIGGVRFDLEVAGQVCGSLNSEGWNAWDFNIKDKTGVEVARISKTWAGWAKERFTKADNYVLQIHQPLQEPLRSLAIATAVAVDTALKQGTQTRGGGLLGPPRRYQ